MAVFSSKMGSMMEEIKLETSRKEQISDITREVQAIVKRSGVEEGVCHIYTPHATCAVMINENWDPNIMGDIINALDSLIPSGKWAHDRVDNNGAAHIKCSLIGPSESVFVKAGKMMLGRWQSIMLCDFDGPRERTVFVKVV